MSDLDLRTLDFNEAWNTFKTEAEMNTDEYRKARFGIRIKFDINDYLKGRLVIKAKKRNVYIKGCVYDLEEFETELEMRERKIKKWLIENLGDDDIVKPRSDE